MHPPALGSTLLDSLHWPSEAGLALLPIKLVLLLSHRGMDGRVHHPRTKKEMAYVVALGGAAAAVC